MFQFQSHVTAAQGRKTIITPTAVVKGENQAHVARVRFQCDSISFCRALMNEQRGFGLGRQPLACANWDSTLGYAGEGPHARARLRAGAQRAQLTSMRGRRWSPSPRHPPTAIALSPAQSLDSVPRRLPPRRKLKRGGSLPEGDDPQQYYEVDEIVNEQKDFKTKVLFYEVVWKGVNPATGERWPNDLIPASDCNEQLIADWLKVRANRSPLDRCLSLVAVEMLWYERVGGTLCCRLLTRRRERESAHALEKRHQRSLARSNKTKDSQTQATVDL